MPLSTITYMSEEEAMQIASHLRSNRERLEKWKAKQPEYIAQEMTNKEIIKDIQSGKFIVFNNMIAFEGGANDRILIKGNLYKKVKNPKIKGNKIIPW